MGAYDEQASTADSVWAVFAGAAGTLEQPDDADACPIATVALEGAFVLSRARRSTEPMFAAGRLALAGLR